MLYGPHGAPDFFTEDDIAMIRRTEWRVHYNSNRTGVRLIGPKPQWARRDGGEAGLHPSNIHDNAYAIGAVDFTGDMPIILGPDGPSLGGFVCPFVVIQADLWKVGQLAPGDTVSASSRSSDAAGRGAPSRPRIAWCVIFDRARSRKRPRRGGGEPRSSAASPARAIGRRWSIAARATAICWSNTARSCWTWS